MTESKYLNQCNDCKMVFTATVAIKCPFCSSTDLKRDIVEIIGDSSI